MYTLLIASWLCLPAFPLNPVAQDTIASVNVHFTVGLSGPNSLVGSGPEITSKYEIRLIHPVVVRAAFDYRYGKVNSILFPKGTLHSATVSTDALTIGAPTNLPDTWGLDWCTRFITITLPMMPPIPCAKTIRSGMSVSGRRSVFG